MPVKTQLLPNPPNTCWASAELPANRAATRGDLAGAGGVRDQGQLEALRQRTACLKSTEVPTRYSLPRAIPLALPPQRSNRIL